MGTSYPMSAGNGPQSYAQNSTYQKIILEEASRRIYDTISDKLELNGLRDLETNRAFTIRIADLGCSTGPNTFTAVQNIIQALQQKLLLQSSAAPQLVEFQVLFNDHVNNDFNTLLRSLPTTTTSSSPRIYFAAAVPGSFHGRLFPRSSLHFIHCSTALHWLSDLPKGVAEKGSIAWNGGSICDTGLVEPVHEAYSVQFRTDFLAFLRSRAEEVVSGGWIAIVMPGRPQGVVSCRTSLGIYFDVLAAALTDLTKLGLIDREKVESFNIPMHLPTVGEMADIVTDDGSFSIEKAEEVTLDSKPAILATTNSDDKQLVVEAAAGAMRAVSEALIRQHFGFGDDEDEVVNQLFQCCASRVTDAYHDLFNPNVIVSNILLMLKRNHSYHTPHRI